MATRETSAAVWSSSWCSRTWAQVWSDTPFDPEPDFLHAAHGLVHPDCGPRTAGDLLLPRGAEARFSSLYVPRPRGIALSGATLNPGPVPKKGTALPADQQSTWSQAPAPSGVATQMPLTRKRSLVLNSNNPHSLEPPYGIEP